jgi:hypothetical protein
LPITARLPRLVAVDAAVCHRAESLDLVDIGSCQGNHGRNEEGKAMVRSFGRRNIILLSPHISQAGLKGQVITTGVISGKFF